MPKVVNPQQRVALLTEAVFVILCKEGMHGITLAGVAKHTNLAIGSVRHYFPTRHLLVESAIRSLIDTIVKRINDHYQVFARQAEDTQTLQDRQQLTVAVVQELLPYDERRRQEAILWLRLINEGIHDPDFQPYAAHLLAGMREVVARILTTALDYPIKTDPYAVEHLSTVIDGLTLDMITAGSGMTLQKARGLLLYHVQNLPQTP